MRSWLCLLLLCGAAGRAVDDDEEGGVFNPGTPNGVMGKDATDDDDATPAGMFNKGDGLDNFEEYRGFAISGHWRLLDDDADGMPWRFGSEDWPDMRVWQQPDDIDQRGKH